VAEKPESRTRRDCSSRLHAQRTNYRLSPEVHMPATRIWCRDELRKPREVNCVALIKKETNTGN
jgi:hypothetical protein